MKTTKSLAAFNFLGKAALLGMLVMSVSACVDPYDPYPPPHRAEYSNGYYSYYDYPSDYHYYGDRYRDNCSGYHGDNDCDYRERRDSLNHTHDMNFHNRDDYDHYDR